MDLEILIIHLNGKEVLRNCLKSIFKDNSKAKVRLLFNNTTDDSLKVLNEFPKVEHHISNERLGFAQASNVLAKKSKAKYVIFLNNDVVVEKNWANELLKTIKKNKKCIAVQSKIRSYYKRSYFEYAGAAGGFVDKYAYPFCRGRIFGDIEKDNGQYDDERRVFWGCGVSLLVDRKYFIDSGMFDESFFMYAEELDFCWRANNSGKEIWYSPKSVIYHIGSFSVNKEKINFKKEYLISRNHFICLIKNNTFPELIPLVAGKLFLEIISLIRFPLSRGIPFLLSIPSVFYHLIFSRHHNLNKKVIKSNSLPLIYQKSIAIEHFLKHKKKYSDLS